ncbi:hypothetical protein [Streptomyces silvensis]|uniref:Uncharacterized protein n=1 Tax=Streptomyces silvensis TaxID=1765722 RepID=A0A0W7X703_9ACTN|nr:hypothetical protein [Streptomyces silvensis]KUF18718.1 hypothetical protein AT728_06600 [Streptomyces silvensis]
MRGADEHLDAHVGDEPPRHTAYDTTDGPAPERTAPGTGHAEDAAVEELIRVAVVTRPLDDVVDLVTRLEQAPGNLPTAVSVLRLAAVARSVEDVSRLVELLAPPEHPAEQLDDAIRHAATERPIPDVSRLVHLLSRPPHDPHSGAEAVHAAATTRSVDDLMQLIGSLGDPGDRRADADLSQAHPLAAPGKDRAESAAADRESAATAADARAAARGPATAKAARGRDARSRGAGSPDARARDTRARDSRARDIRARSAQVGGAPLVWLRRLAGVLVLLCAVAHFPLRWTDASAFALSAAFGVSAVCAASGVVLFLSKSPVVAVTSTLVVGVLAVSHLADDRVDSRTLAHVLRPDGVTPPLPALSALVATLACLLVVALTVAGLRAAATPPRTGARG